MSTLVHVFVYGKCVVSLPVSRYIFSELALALNPFTDEALKEARIVCDKDTNYHMTLMALSMDRKVLEKNPEERYATTFQGVPVLVIPE